MSTLPHGIIHLAPGYRLERDEPTQAYMLRHLDHIFPLSSTQGAILEHCNGSLTKGGIIESMQQQLPGIDPQEVLDFLQTAYLNNWIHGQ